MTLTITVWDVWQGDCTVIRLPNDQLLIIDVGPPDSPLVEWLRANPQERIYGIVLTHNDEDHSGAFESVLETCRGKIDNLWVLFDRSDSDTVSQRIMGAAVRYAQKQKINYNALIGTKDNPMPIYAYGSSRPLLIYSVHPSSLQIAKNQLARSSAPNSVSGIICLEIGGNVRAIWTGDAPMSAVSRACHGSSPQLIVGPHHGAPTDRKRRSYPSYFIDPDPEVVFVSVGTYNRHDHPIPDFIKRHVAQSRVVCCSGLNYHCDRQRATDGPHVINSHMSLSVVPPPNPKAVSCRGPMQLTWDEDYGEFLYDRFHDRHQAQVQQITGRCCKPLSVPAPPAVSLQRKGGIAP